ncbi:MAG: hypothetical protein MUO51_09430 [Woeseiaceae bacterium]|nr:hypothetical protein [Woeseiaceae bacterium]
MTRNLISLAALFATFFSFDAVACSCASKNIKEAVDSSQHIFVAEITSAQKNPDTDSTWNSVSADFEIIDVIKGAPHELGRLYSGVGGGDCGVPFLVGHKLIIFTNDGTVTTCGATRSIGIFTDDNEYVALLKSYVKDGIEFEFDNYPAVGGVAILNCNE